MSKDKKCSFVFSRHYGFCFPAPSGDGTEKIYEYKVDDQGRKHLVDTGRVHNIYEKIQSLKDGADFKETIKRILNGDMSKIDVNAGVYCDVTQLPSDVPSLLNHMNDLENKFNKLPLDIKSKFGNEFGQYLAAAKNGTLVNTLKSDVNLMNKYFKDDIVIDDSKEFIDNNVNKNVDNNVNKFVESEVKSDEKK